MQTQAVLASLQEQGIKDVYIELLKEIYTNSSMTVHLHKEGNKSTTGRYHIAQAFYGHTRKHIPTTNLKIGEHLNHLRFADDILMCSDTPHELQQLVEQLADESKNQGMTINKSKTKVMMETTH